MVFRAFLTGFFATSLFLAFATSEPTSRAPSSTPSALNIAKAQQRVEPAESPNTDTISLSPAMLACNQRLQAPLGAFGIRFDHRSEQLKAESRQLIYSIIEISADCPQAHLAILPPPGTPASDELTSRRIDALVRQFDRGGLTATGATLDDQVLNASDWTLQFIVP